MESAARWALQARALVNSHASRALERSGAVGVGASPSGDKNSNGLPPSSTIPQHAHSRQNTYFVRSDLPPTRGLRGPSAVHAELAGAADQGSVCGRGGGPGRAGIALGQRRSDAGRDAAGDAAAVGCDAVVLTASRER